MLFVSAIAAAFAPAMHVEPWEAALHFGLYGAVIVFPLTLIGGVPLFALARLFGLVRRRAVMAAGALLALAYPVLVSMQNEPGTVSPWAFFICVAAGLVAALVFCQVAGVRRDRE